MAKDHWPKRRKQQEVQGLRKKGTSKERAAKIANTPDGSKKGEKNSGRRKRWGDQGGSAQRGTQERQILIGASVLLELTLPAETTSVPTARHAVSDALAEHVNDLLPLKVAVSEAVGNAVAHAYPDQAGEISVKAEVDGEQVLLEVRDWGRGILLDPLGSTGLGLGLALIAKVAAALTIRSNGGTHLLMWFPALASAGPSRELDGAIAAHRK